MTTKYLHYTAATMSIYVRVTSVIYLLEVRESGGIGGIEERTSQFFHVLLYLHIYSSYTQVCVRPPPNSHDSYM
jgi:hypothetical protein